MKLFLAGNSGHGKVGIYRESFLIQNDCNRLMSYFWHGPEGEFKQHFKEWKNAKDNVPGHRNDRS